MIASRTCFACLTLLLLGFLASPGQGQLDSRSTGAPPAEAGTDAPSPRILPELVERFSKDEAELRRFYNIAGTQQRLQRLERFYGDWHVRLDRMEPEALGIEDAIDWTLLRSHVNHLQKRILHLRARLQETAPLLTFRPELTAIEERRWREAPVNSREVATLLAKLQKEVDGLKERVESGISKEPADDAIITTPVIARRAARNIDGLLRSMEAWFRNYDGFLPEFSWWVKKPYAQLRSSMESYRDMLRKKVAKLEGKDDDPLIGDPIGEEALRDALDHEMIPYSPRQLIEIGKAELRWCQAEMAKAVKELDKADVAAALEHVKSIHSEPGKQAELIMQQSRDAIAFVDERDLVSVPALCRETWRFRMLGERAQRTLPFAAYGGQDMLVAYPTEGMEHDDKLMTMRGNNIPFTRIVTPHELIPGHHLQGFMAARYNTHRGLFRTPFLVEGWCLYWEMLLWNLDYARTAEERIGMLFWRSHRCARIIVSLGFHMGEMEAPEMIDFLVDEIGHERSTATSEVRRYVGDAYGPLYQAGYMIGGLQFMALREELVDSGTMSDRAFHDAVLRMNSIPVAMIRAQLLGRKPGRNHVPDWKFYGEVPEPERQ